MVKASLSRSFGRADLLKRFTTVHFCPCIYLAPKVSQCAPSSSVHPARELSKPLQGTFTRRHPVVLEGPEWLGFRSSIPAAIIKLTLMSIFRRFAAFRITSLSMRQRRYESLGIP
jgi:hypothetical protein